MASIIRKNIETICAELPENVLLCVVSKTHPAEKIMEAYHAGIRDFGENKVQEMLSKKPQLPTDIRWHLIGHLQTNKVKQVVGVADFIQSVDSEKLLLEIEKVAAKKNITQKVLLQIFIAKEETKFGLDFSEAETLINQYKNGKYPHTSLCGLMGMATFTNDETQIRNEFASLKNFFNSIKEIYFSSDDNFSTLSMGMSSDYSIAIEEGSTLVRVGSKIFGERNYTTS